MSKRKTGCRACGVVGPHVCIRERETLEDAERLGDAARIERDAKGRPILLLGKRRKGWQR